MLIVNGAPWTRTLAQCKFPAFTETGSISHCRKMLLHSPIALGDHLTERSQKDAYRVMLRALDYGCLYAWYSSSFPVGYKTLTEHMYPTTPDRDPSRRRHRQGTDHHQPERPASAGTTQATSADSCTTAKAGRPRSIRWRKSRAVGRPTRRYGFPAGIPRPLCGGSDRPRVGPIRWMGSELPLTRPHRPASKQRAGVHSASTPVRVPVGDQDLLPGLLWTDLPTRPCFFPFTGDLGSGRVGRSGDRRTTWRPPHNVETAPQRGL